MRYTVRSISQIFERSTIVSIPIHPDFFQIGGTLRPGDPSYIHRMADDELFTHILAGHYCYVLTSRQRGKSSLMVHTAERLRQVNIAVILVDLSQIGKEISPEEWYFGIITRIVADLHIALDVHTWWRSRTSIGPVQRLNDFLSEVVLPNTTKPIVIFFDEIDTTLAVDFSDDFFAVIRQMYNLRASNSTYDRLTCVLLGVATPSDLIKDPNRTPFNIGRRVRLGEFRRVDALPLEAPLDTHFSGCGSLLLDRVFFWTGGHPYLTQRLCQALVDLPSNRASEDSVDTLVGQLFQGEAARIEHNLRYVQNSVEALPPRPRRSVLMLYRQVLAGAIIMEDQREIVQERLRLIGLVRAEDGKIKVRNEIYRRTFDLSWTRTLMPIDRVQLVIIMSIVIITFVTIFGGIFLYNQYQENRRIAMIADLSQRCGLSEVQREKAIEDFFSASLKMQLSLFETANEDQIWKQQQSLAYCIKTKLPSLKDPMIIHRICTLTTPNNNRYSSDIEQDVIDPCEQR